MKAGVAGRCGKAAHELTGGGGGRHSSSRTRPLPIGLAMLKSLLRMFAERRRAASPANRNQGIVGEDQPGRGDAEFERIDAGIAEAK